jgi:putative endonuclease
MAWYVYMVRCRDGNLYCGVAKDVLRRIAEHNNSNRGSRYTRARRPVALAWRKRLASRSAACREEARIKSLPKRSKETLCRGTACKLPRRSR